MPQRFRAQIAPREKREKRNRPSSADRKCPSRNPAPEGARWAAARIFGTGKRERGTFPTPGIPLRAMAPVFGTGAGNSGPGDPAHVTGTRVTRPRFGRETRSTGYSSDIPGRCGRLYAPPDLPTAAHYRDENSLNSGHPRGPVWRPRGHPACGDPYPRRGRGPVWLGDSAINGEFGQVYPRSPHIAPQSRWEISQFMANSGVPVANLATRARRFAVNIRTIDPNLLGARQSYLGNVWGIPRDRYSNIPPTSPHPRLTSGRAFRAPPFGF